MNNYSQYIKSALAYATSYSRHRRHEVKWTVWGISIGAISGWLLGGVGIAVGGSAFGVSGAILFAILGALLGSRIGIGKDKKPPIEQRIP